MRVQCNQCGRTQPSYCSSKNCPFFSSRPRTIKKEFVGTSPNLFIGSYGYPDVRVGLLATEHYDDSDNPKAWMEQKTSIPEIVDKRSSLINSQFMANIQQAKSSFLETTQLVAQASKPVDVDVKLDKTPEYKIAYPRGTRPHGASVGLKQATLTENVKVKKAIDKAVSDTDAKATTVLNELYGQVDEYQLTKLLTGGLLGQGAKRKLVPTRWGITAVDDTLGKRLLQKIKEYPEVSEITVHYGGAYGNYFIILLIPRHWSYELMEHMTSSGDSFSDYEGIHGRSQYAQSTAGGYYASKLPVLEHLQKLKRQASVLCLRVITEEYTNPLGVWVVREAAREALTSNPLHFETLELALRFMELRAQKHQATNPLRGSELLAALKQKTLSDF